MKFGKFEVSTHNLGWFRLDGGSMFGSVPKNLWNQKIPGDEQNRILLATRSLLIKDGARTFLVDVGCGDKWSEKEKSIYAVENFPVKDWGFNTQSVTDVILTHMHFDHGGGISKWKDSERKEIEPCYPKATHYIQADNMIAAKSPNIREKASYLKENYAALEMVKVKVTKGSEQIYPGIWVHACYGHTSGQQWIEVQDGAGRSIMFTTDLIPTSHHLPLPYHMGYDLWAYKLLEEKQAFLKKAIDTNSILVFQHCPHVPAATITKNEKGHYAVKEKIEF